MPPTPRKRSRASAKAAGARFEREISDYLAQNWDDHIDRKVRRGAKDQGDLANFRTKDGRKICVEIKNTAKLSLPQFWREAEQERDNAGDHHALIIAKRHGVADPGKQWAIMSLEELLNLLGGHQ